MSSNKFLINNKANALPPPDWDIEIFGNGGLRGSAGGAQSGASPANGSIGASFIRKGETEVLIGFTVNNFKTIDVNTPELFGSNLLIPDLEGLSFTLNVSKIIKSKMGVYGELIFSSSKWKLDQNLEFPASPMSLKLNFLYAPFNNIEKNSNVISLSFSGGYSLRGVLGNIGNEDILREKYFGTSRKFFSGFELGADLKINSTKVFINIPLLASKDKVDGLTSGQVVIGVTVSGKLLKL